MCHGREEKRKIVRKRDEKRDEKRDDEDCKLTLYYQQVRKLIVHVNSHNIDTKKLKWTETKTAS